MELFSKSRKFFHPLENNFVNKKSLARSKAAPLEKRTLVVAVGYSLALPKGTKLACALRSSSSQKSRFAAIFGNPVAAYLRLLRKGVNVRDFYYFSRKENHTFPQRNSIWQNFACCRKGECARFL